MTNLSRPTRVLFIDDAEDITSLCKVVLSKTNFHIESAKNGKSGIELVKSFQPQVIFLDMVLPDLNGLEVVEKIFSMLPEGERPVVYAFTNHHEDYFGDHLQEVGIRRCVQKVGNLDTLRSVLTEAIDEAMLAGAKNNSSMRVMLVEDNAADVQLFKILLKNINTSCELHEVRDGEEATKYIIEDVCVKKAPPPDLIFLDLNLPRKDGKKVLEEFKKAEGIREIPIIILTTSKNEDDIRDCYNLYANCFLTKPSDLNEFKSLIKQIESFWFKTVKLPRPLISAKAF